MSRLGAFQDAFVRALFGARGEALERALADPSAAGGFDVYRNNVMTALVDGLEKDFPAVERLVGRDFFRAMAGQYVRAEPPASPALTLYGASFPRFVAAFPPAQDLVYLSDVARLDRAWIESLFAADADALRPDGVRADTDDAFARLRAAPHPSARLIASPHAAYSIWRANREEGAFAPVAAAGPETALIWKQTGAVRHQLLNAGEAAFLQALFSGAVLSDAADDSAAADPDFDPILTFATFVAAGVFAATQGDAS